MNFRDKRLYLLIAVFFIIISGLIYFYENLRIPKLTKAATIEIKKEIDISAMPKKLVATVVDKEGIAKYTEITEEIISTKIKMIEVPEKFVPDNPVTDLNLIKGRITKESLKSGEQLVIDSFSKEQKWFGELERLKEYNIKSTVADILKSGNIVDVLIVYGNGDYDVVLPKVKIKKLVKSENSIEGKNENIQIVIPVNEIDTRDMIAANQLGEFDVRIYLDESQQESIKTFDYERAKEQLKLLEISEKYTKIIKDKKEESTKIQLTN